jgi:LmbE family N-acetylglucosaminyl deacetylase
LSRQALKPIVVSTHFDDAALSLAHVLQGAGALATVVTVCGGEPPAGVPVSDWDTCSGFASGVDAARTRLLEDAAACAVTGARAHPLNHCDSPYAPLPSPAVLRAEIAPLVQEDCILWLTAGFVNPDHADVRAALLPLAKTLPPGRVRTYVDLPYAANDELPDTNELRLTDAAFELKLTAVRCHASQLPLLQKTWPDLLERHGALSRERTVKTRSDPR